MVVLLIFVYSLLYLLFNSNFLYIMRCHRFYIYIFAHTAKTTKQHNSHTPYGIPIYLYSNAYIDVQSISIVQWDRFRQCANLLNAIIISQKSNLYIVQYRNSHCIDPRMSNGNGYLTSVYVFINNNNIYCFFCVLFIINITKEKKNCTVTSFVECQCLFLLIFISFFLLTFVRFGLCVTWLKR